jgi:hypothetical protein
LNQRIERKQEVVDFFLYLKSKVKELKLKEQLEHIIELKQELKD